MRRVVRRSRSTRRPATAARVEQPYRERFEKSSVPQTTCDRDGVLTEVNPAFLRLLDRPAAEVVGRRLQDLNHRSDPGAADQSLRQLLTAATEATQTERILARTDGRPVPTLVSATVLRDGGGRLLGAAALYQDLSMLHSVEQRRRQQEDFFLALAQRASDLAVVLDPEGRVLFASPAVAGVLGHAVEDVLSELALQYVSPTDGRTTRRLFARVLTRGGTATDTVRIRDAKDEWHWMELTASNLLDTAVGGVVCNLRDVTDRVHAEEALRASERRYRAIADNADQGLWVTAPDGRTVYVNQRLVDILGIPAEDILGRAVLEVLDPGDQTVTRQRTVTADDRPTARHDVVYAHPDGGRRILVVSATPLDDADGALEGSMSMVS